MVVIYQDTGHGSSRAIYLEGLPGASRRDWMHERIVSASKLSNLAGIPFSKLHRPESPKAAREKIRTGHSQIFLP